MRSSITLISLLLSLSACDQAAQENSSTHNQLGTQVSQKKDSVKAVNSAEEMKDEDRYPLFFIEVAKNLNISTTEFAQAMQRAGDNNASMENAAKELGIPLADLQAALPKRPPRKITFQPTGGEPVELKNIGANKSTAEKTLPDQKTSE